MPQLTVGRATALKVIGGDVQLLAPDGELTRIFAKLKRLKLNLSDMKPVFSAFGKYIVDDHIPRQFKMQGTPKRWAPLSQKYAEWKRAHYGNLPILVLTGRMRAGFRYEANPRTLVIINRVKAGQSGGIPRWMYHQMGTVKMPARPMLQIGPRDRKMLSDVALEYLLFGKGEGQGSP